MTVFYDRTGSLEKEMNGFPRVLTNFTPTHLPIYESAIQMYGDPNLYVMYQTDIPTLGVICSLMVKGPRKEREEFWRLFEKLKNFAGIK